MRRWALFLVTVLLTCSAVLGEGEWKDQRERPNPLTDEALYGCYWKDNALKRHTGAEKTGGFPIHYRRACETMELSEDVQGKLEETWLAERKKQNTFIGEYWIAIHKFEEDIELEEKAGKKSNLPAMVTRLQRYRKEGFIKILAMDRTLDEALNKIIDKKNIATWRAHVMAEWSMLPFRKTMEKQQIAKVHTLCLNKRGPIAGLRTYKSYLLATWEIQDMVFAKLLTKAQREKAQYRDWRGKLKQYAEERDLKREEAKAKKAEEEQKRKERRKRIAKKRALEEEERKKKQGEKPSDKKPEDKKPETPDDNIGGF